nr:hypothetical protein [Tanacetum cinerariifolium]
MEYCEVEDDCFTNFETEYPAIVFDDTLMFDTTLSCEPMVSPLNENKIDFRISFDESDDEDYMVIFDNNSFSYKVIYVDNLKIDSENDNVKFDMPSFPSLEPTVSYSDDLDYFKDFETEFPDNVYNDALASKLDSLTEPAVSPHHIDKLSLKNDTSLSKYDEKEQNIVYFNDLFPLNMIYLDNLKSDKDNDDDDEINIIQYLGGGRVQSHGISDDLVLFVDMETLPPRDQRHPWLRYQVEGYTEDIVHSYEQRLEMIFGRPVNRVHTLDFAGLTEGMRQTLAGRLRMIYVGDEGHELFISHAWRILFEIQGPEQTPEKVADIDLFYLRSMDRGTANVLYLLTQYLFRHAERRKSGAREAAGCCDWCPEAAEDAPSVDKGAQAKPAPVQAPQPPHAAPRTMS